MVREQRRDSEESDRAGDFASFPYDGATIERFREAFPRARWSDERKSWFVPGKSAARRITRWLAREAEHADPYGDLRGRDAYVFEPIASRYLEVGDDLRVRTPYSKSVIDELRQVPWAHWDDDLRVWRVPFRSYEELRRRWARIEEAARRSEPEERKRRREAERDSDAHRIARAHLAERRRRRYPVPADDLPPMGRPVATNRYGVVVFVGTVGEIAESASLAEFYPQVQQAERDYVWARWRSPTLPELISTWPARRDPGAEERARGWWQPTLPELRVARRNARSLARRQQSRREHAIESSHGASDNGPGA